MTGAYKNHPERAKDREGEPKDIDPLGQPPKHLTEKERNCWLEFESQCAAGVLTIMDRQVLEIASTLMVKFRDSEKSLVAAELSMLIRCLSLMGMTPSDRSRLNVHPAPQKDGDGWDKA